MKNSIKENSKFRLGDEIYNPLTDEYFMIVSYYYMENYNEVMVFVESSNKNLEEKVVSYRLSHLIRLGYYIIS